MSGRIITFYSYKGGVGRSMALANIATLLAKLNKKVLIIDWDLEAPGIHKFFKKPQIDFNGNEGSSYGVVDLLYSKIEDRNIDWKSCLIRVEFDEVGLDILTAGKQDSSYQKRVQELNWEVLYDKGIGNYLNSLRNEWIKEYDFILVDSRTGITDIGDICTVILPDIVIVMFVSNYQNVDGIETLYERAVTAHKNLPVDRGKLIVIPIPSRDETYTEYDKSEEWKDIYASRFARFFSNWLPANISPREALNKLFIPYVAKWSFGECLPVIENEYEIQKPTSISAAYNRITQLIVDEFDWYKTISQSDPLEYKTTKSELSQANIKIEKTETKLKLTNYIAIVLILLFSVIIAVFTTYWIKTNQEKERRLELAQSRIDSLVNTEATQKSIYDERMALLDSISMRNRHDAMLSSIIYQTLSKPISKKTKGQVQIGTQIWMAYNLNVEHYKNGKMLPQAKTKEEWQSYGDQKTGCWCYLNYDSSQNRDGYGKIYNSYALYNESGLAPNGYRIPTEDDWRTLVEFLGGAPAALDKMKSASGWCNDGNGNNGSGLNVFPNGSVDYNGKFECRNCCAWLWSSSIETSSGRPEAISLSDNGNDVGFFYIPVNSGRSIRCIKVK